MIGEAAGLAWQQGPVFGGQRFHSFFDNNNTITTTIDHKC